jgi:hypothetical protein
MHRRLRRPRFLSNQASLWLEHPRSKEGEGSSWPDGYAWAIESFGAGGDPNRQPFGDRVLFERLCVVHARLRGWLCLDDDNNIVFENLAEFRETGTPPQSVPAYQMIAATRLG